LHGNAEQGAATNAMHLRAILPDAIRTITGNQNEREAKFSDCFI
jgi:hypothetical protein